MSPDEFDLLDNLFQSLDRLYDQETSVVELQALCHASAVALGVSGVGREAQRVAGILGLLVRSPGAESEKNAAALVVTDRLRAEVGEALQGPVVEPRPRRPVLDSTVEVAMLREVAAAERTSASGRTDRAKFLEAFADALS